jgi:isoaspartyl peptidase/L-asparaginase-like protein (Ntn-hydrolase superfamily)
MVSIFPLGAVIGLQGIKNPISVAKAVLYEKPILLAGKHAIDYAQQKGFSAMGNKQQKKEWQLVIRWVVLPVTKREI